MCDDKTYMCDDKTCVCDDKTYVYDDKTYVCDDKTYVCDDNLQLIIDPWKQNAAQLIVCCEPPMYPLYSLSPLVISCPVILQQCHISSR